MGCSESKISDVQTMNLCKERKAFMKQSILACNAFAASHCAYSEALKNTGAALRDYAEGKFQFSEDVPLASSHPPYHSFRPYEKDGIWDFFISLMEYDLAKVDKSSRIEKSVIQRKVVENRSEHGGDGEVRIDYEGMHNVNLLQVFTKLDDGFLKASKSAHKISKILEGKKLYYHSKFADNQGSVLI